MFENITIVDIPHFPSKHFEKLKQICSGKIHAFEHISPHFERAVSQANVLLVGVNTLILGDLLRRCPKLKYIGVYGTTLHNVDLVVAKKLKIQVRNVQNYCDSETAELILAELMSMARGIGAVSWNEKFHSLIGKKLGIVGLGSVGQQLASMASSLGLLTYYTGRTRKFDFGLRRCSYLEKTELLNQCDIISLHVPPFVQALTAEDFSHIQTGSIVVSTSQGRVWDAEAMMRWLEHSENRLILDQFAYSQLDAREQQDLVKNNNVRISPVSGHSTVESIDRIADLFLKDLMDFAHSKRRASTYSGYLPMQMGMDYSAF